MNQTEVDNLGYFAWIHGLVAIICAVCFYRTYGDESVHVLWKLLGFVTVFWNLHAMTTYQKAWKQHQPQ